jgi:uncharacterized NAD(P)/FAD-binding protein YdhS
MPIAVIGAGFSGTMAALQLLAHLPPERSVLLCEQAETFGRGLAYATGNPDHLLNLRASNMSAFPDRPGDFEAWLARADLDPQEATGVRVTPAGTFAARGLYGRYLAELLTGAVTGSDGARRLRLVNDRVVDLEPAGPGFVLRLQGGRTRRVAGAVLAMGNLPGLGSVRSRHRIDPWAVARFGPLDPDRPILIVGTGLTMVDAVAALRRNGFPGPIVALSRHGFLPNPHAATASWPQPDLAPAVRGSLRMLVARIRREIAVAEAAGVGWRGVIDALRPVVDSIWRGLPLAERARFLRHVRPFWDVHRHRTAPPAAETIAEEIARGTLAVTAGRCLTVVDEAAGATVKIRPRGATRTRTIEVQGLVDATGFGRVAETDDPLVRNLIARGLAQGGPFGLGLDATADHRVVGPRGRGRIWALGPLLRGVLWECTAVPDIRNEAASLARIVAEAG